MNGIIRQKPTKLLLPEINNPANESNDTIEIRFTDDDNEDDKKNIEEKIIEDTILVETKTQEPNEEIEEDEKSADEKPDEEKRKPKKSKQVGPGRPRKNPKKEPIPKKGISKTPIDPEHVVEFMYDNPLMIRKIVAFFKSIAAQQIQIIFRAQDIIMYAKDHHEKSHIRIRIDATKLNHYYCKTNLDIGIAQKDLEMVLNVVDKDYNSIVIVSKKATIQEKITVILENSIEIDENQDIELIGQYNHMDNEQIFINETYTIYWQWSGKYFKKFINDIKTISDDFAIIQERCDKPLMFSHCSVNRKIHKAYIVKNSGKIKLKSKLLGDDSFRIDMRVEYIKPISSAHIADDILILVDENKPLMTKAMIDNGVIEIKTLTEIIDDRHVEN
jgi:hypothetical protein